MSCLYVLLNAAIFNIIVPLLSIIVIFNERSKRHKCNGNIANENSGLPWTEKFNDAIIRTINIKQEDIRSCANYET